MKARAALVTVFALVAVVSVWVEAASADPEVYETTAPTGWSYTSNGFFSGGGYVSSSTSNAPYTISKTGPGIVRLYGSKGTGCALRHRVGSGAWTGEDCSAASLELNVLLFERVIGEGSLSLQIERTAGTVVLDYWTFESTAVPDPVEIDAATPADIEALRSVVAVGLGVAVFFAALHVVGHLVDG